MKRLFITQLSLRTPVSCAIVVKKYKNQVKKTKNLSKVRQSSTEDPQVIRNSSRTDPIPEGFLSKKGKVIGSGELGNLKDQSLVLYLSD